MKIIKAPPPVSERPTCPNCGERLQPRMWSETVRRDRPRADIGERMVSGGYDYVIVSKEWQGDYHSYGAFCTLRCAAAFANAAHKAGYRLKGKP
jgi:hypothetical protein